MPHGAPCRSKVPSRSRLYGLVAAALLSGAGALAPALAEDGPSGAAADALSGPAAVEPSDRVVNGTPTSHDVWPSLVLIHMVDPKGKTFMCGGSVIARGWVLTAGHCAHGFVASKMTVIEGISSQFQIGHRLGVKEVIVQDGYVDSPEPHDDVALLRLSEPARSPSQTLATDRGAAGLLNGEKAGEVAGFGLTQPQRSGAPHVGQVSKRLLQAKLPLVGTEACRAILGRAMGDPNVSKVIDEATICAGDMKGGGDSCSGDSGGPLSMDVSRNLKVQVGVVSWGPGCAQPGTVGVYAALGHFEGWIRQHVPEAVFYDVTSNPVAVSTTGRPGGPQQTAEAALDQEAQSLSPNAALRVTLAEGPTVHVGETIHVEVSSDMAGQLLVYNVDVGSGAVYQVYPNAYAAKGDTPLTVGSKVVVPGHDDDFTIEVRAPFGRNRIYAFVVPPGEAVRAVASRGMDMRTLSDAQGVIAELDRAVVVVPKPHAVTDRASALFDYEILR